MKTFHRFLIACAALAFAGAVVAEEAIQPGKMSDPELLARTRQLTQEAFELSKVAVQKGGSGKVQQLARREVESGEIYDKRLTDLAAEAGVTQPEKISRPMQERLTAIEKMSGDAFDADYLSMLLDLHREHILVLEEFTKRTVNAKLRDYVADALAFERTQLRAIQALAAPEIPSGTPN